SGCRTASRNGSSLSGQAPRLTEHMTADTDAPHGFARSRCVGTGMRSAFYAAHLRNGDSVRTCALTTRANGLGVIRSQQCGCSPARFGGVLEAVPAAGGDHDYRPMALDEEPLVRRGCVDAGLNSETDPADRVAQALTHPVRRVPGSLPVRPQPVIRVDHRARSVERGL